MKPVYANQPMWSKRSSTALKSSAKHAGSSRHRAQDGLRKRGRLKKGEEIKGVHSTLLRGSTNAPYLTARIERDRPDILKRLKNGEFKSVRAAAIEAGIIKPPTIVEQLLKLWAKTSEQERGTERMNDDNEPITFRRVQRRLAMLWEVMPRSAKEVYTDQLLPNIIEDLREIKAAVAYLETQQGRTIHD